jgi:hypothetical protein
MYLDMHYDDLLTNAVKSFHVLFLSIFGLLNTMLSAAQIM